MVDWNLLKEYMECAIRNEGFTLDNGDMVISLGELTHELGIREPDMFVTKSGEQYIKMVEIEPNCEIKGPSIKQGYEHILIPRILRTANKFKCFSLVEQKNQTRFIMYHT